MNIEISIFADSVGRGKTSTLKNWLLNQKGIGGVLTPKIEGRRVFELIPSGDILEMESNDTTLQIGRYNFNATHFLQAERRIWEDWQNPEIHTLIIDEIGPLEIKKNQGFHELLNRILKSENRRHKKLIFVVRDYCLQDFISKYPVGNARVITELYFREGSVQRPVGIVLCGGKSSRMGADKSLLNYHSMPQWQYVYHLLKPFCEKVYLSLNTSQAATYALPKEVDFIEDAPQYANHGPISGVMSVISSLSFKPLFIVACDYPLLRMEHLLTLFRNRKPEAGVVCYRNIDYPEPLISILEKSALQKLTEYFNNGKDSLSKFCLETKTTYIDVLNPEFLKNVNSRADFMNLNESWKND